MADPRRAGLLHSGVFPLAGAGNAWYVEVGAVFFELASAQAQGARRDLFRIKAGGATDRMIK